MFTSLITKALENQKNLADATSAEAVKVAFTEGVKHESERQTQPRHSDGQYGLNVVHLLRRATGNAIGPSSVYDSIPVQKAAKLPVCSINNGVTDGNNTFQTMGSFITGKRYKRETNLKFSDGSVEPYESFRSKFNIHHKMLGWDTNRAGMELYMSFEGKAALKLEEVIMNANGTSNITRCGRLSTVLSCLSIIMNQNIGSLP